MPAPISLKAKKLPTNVSNMTIFSPGTLYAPSPDFPPNSVVN